MSCHKNISFSLINFQMWNQGDQRVVILSFDVDHPELGVNMVSHFHQITLLVPARLVPNIWLNQENQGD